MALKFQAAATYSRKLFHAAGSRSRKRRNPCALFCLPRKTAQRGSTAVLSAPRASWQAGNYESSLAGAGAVNSEFSCAGPGRSLTAASAPGHCALQTTAHMNSAVMVSPWATCQTAHFGRRRAGSPPGTIRGTAKVCVAGATVQFSFPSERVDGETKG